MNKEYEVFYGRLGKDPDSRYTQTQKPVCYLSVAIDDETSEGTTWKRVVVWEEQAEKCRIHLKKGSEVFVRGRNQQRSFKGRDGQMVNLEEVNASQVGIVSL